MASEPLSPLSDRQPWWMSLTLLIAPLLLLVATTVYGITEVHSSTDTYIGLAGGRAVLESTDGFPVKDTASYTFNGEPWLNQNWGTHVFQYWLYKNLGPDAVIWGTWAMSSCIFLCTLAAVWFRTRSILGGLIAASVVAFGCRDFISARPATTGFFAISAMWMLICALEGMSGSCRRKWPLLGIVVLLFLWGNSHGSFVFGYVIFGLFAAYWAVVHLWRRFLPTSFSVFDIGLAIFTLIACWFAVEVVINENFFKFPKYKPMLGRAYAMVTLASIGLAAALLYSFVIDRRREPSVAQWQLGGIVGALFLAFLLTLVLGPFGWENFVHGQKVGNSEEWRSVSEWHPPYFPGMNTFPPFWRIWGIFYGVLGVIPIVAALRLYAVFGTTERHGQEPAPGIAWPRLTAFDVLAIGIGLIMTFFARRFAPIFLIFAAPAIASWVILVVRQVPQVSRFGSYAASGASLVALVIFMTYPMDIPGSDKKVLGLPNQAIQIIHNFYPDDAEVGLLEKVTRFDATPTGLLDYLAKNEIEGNLMAEWTQAGMVMFFAPTCKVYMDGRAQQVYDVEHYKRYQQLLMNPRSTPAMVLGELDRVGTEIVMLRNMKSLQHMHVAIQSSTEWRPLMSGPKGTIMIRASSPLYQQIRERADRGEEWRPNTPHAQMGRGFLYRYTSPPNVQKAMEEWVGAVGRDMQLGRILFRYITAELCRVGEVRKAAQFVQQQQQRLQQMPYNETTKKNLLGQLRLCQQMILQTQQQLQEQGGG